MTSFVGRRQATADLRRVLAASRLVTLIGVGGVGKSRLALHTAHQLRRSFADGVWLVELAELRDAALVPQAVAAALGLRDQSTRDPETVLVDYLATKDLLLVVDNCEHVLTECARLVHSLLAAAPGLRVLATSREPLCVEGEYVWPVPPLSVPAQDTTPPAGSGREYEAMALFQDRAAAAVPGFVINPDNEATVARLCARLDGVPLAIELAAVRLRALSVDQILARLEDRFRLLTVGDRSALPRHQTLRAAVDWSHDLCTDHERTLWARCSVFAGEFDLDAAESICTDGFTGDDVLSSVTGLVDKSVLTRQEQGARVRYRMLETIRQYGQERLEAAGEAATMRRRHREHYLRLAEQSDAESCGPAQAEWGQRLHTERANLWAALDYCLTTPDQTRTGLRLASALWFYWIGCGFVRDGRYWFDRALALDTTPSRERTRALWLNGWIAHLQGDTAASLVLLNESRALAGELGDDTELTYALHFLGDAETFVDTISAALPLLDEALARYRAANAWTAPGLLIFAARARAAAMFGDSDGAVALLKEGDQLCTDRGERWAWSWLTWALALIRLAAGDSEKAGGCLRESLRHKDEINDRLGIAFCLEMLAWAAAARNDFERAAVLFGGAEKFWEPLGGPRFGFDTFLSWSEDTKTRSHRAHGGKAYEATRKRGRNMVPEAVIDYALHDQPAPSVPRPRAAEPVSAASQPELTRREREVAALVAGGKSNREIAAHLVISQRTAETHIEHILTKLGFNSRTQIAGWVGRQRR